MRGESDTQFHEGDRVRVTRAYAGSDPLLAPWTGREGTVLIPSRFFTNVVIMDDPPEGDVSARFWDYELEPIKQEEKSS